MLGKGVGGLKDVADGRRWLTGSDRTLRDRVEKIGNAIDQLRAKRPELIGAHGERRDASLRDLFVLHSDLDGNFNRRRHGQSSCSQPRSLAQVSAANDLW